MNRFWFTAGIINVIATIMHLIMGYLDPLLPLTQTGLNDVSMATLFAVWTMATLVMLVSSFNLVYIGIYPHKAGAKELALLWGGLYVAFALVFVIVNVSYAFFSLPQWVLLLPIGLLALYGRK